MCRQVQYGKPPTVLVRTLTTQTGLSWFEPRGILTLRDHFCLNFNIKRKKVRRQQGGSNWRMKIVTAPRFLGVPLLQEWHVTTRWCQVVGLLIEIRSFSLYLSLPYTPLCSLQNKWIMKIIVRRWFSLWCSVGTWGIANIPKVGQRRYAA